MNILVTGCAGFIGWKVSEILLTLGYTVIGIDNLNTTYDPRLKRWRLEQLNHHFQFSFFQTDICDQKHMEQIFKTHCFDAVINLAARAGVRLSVENPWDYMDTNLVGTLNLLELCRRYGIRKFVLASTSSLYGGNKMPFREDQATDRPLSPYAASKKAAEVLCYTYHHLYDLDITVLRYFTVYGPAGRPDMSIFRFIQRIAEGRPITIYGDGSQERDFTYVDDVAQGTLAALKPVGYEIINLGSDRPVKLLEVIRRIEGLLGRKAAIEYRPRHPADVAATWADISKARRLLNWQPQVSLEEKLKKSVNWYIQNRQWAKDIEVGEV